MWAIHFGSINDVLIEDYCKKFHNLKAYSNRHNRTLIGDSGKYRKITQAAQLVLMVNVLLHSQIEASHSNLGNIKSISALK